MWLYGHGCGHAVGMQPPLLHSFVAEENNKECSMISFSHFTFPCQCGETAACMQRACLRHFESLQSALSIHDKQQS
jgi:hypothetical protein